MAEFVEIMENTSGMYEDARLPTSVTAATAAAETDVNVVVAAAAAAGVDVATRADAADAAEDNRLDGEMSTGSAGAADVVTGAAGVAPAELRTGDLLAAGELIIIKQHNI